MVFKGEKIELEVDFFRGSDFLEQVVFANPDGVVSLGYKCFGNCSIKAVDFACKDVTVKDGGLESLGDYLQEITFNNSGTTTLENAAFYSEFVLDYKDAAASRGKHPSPLHCKNRTQRCGFVSLSKYSFGAF